MNRNWPEMFWSQSALLEGCDTLKRRALYFSLATLEARLACWPRQKVRPTKSEQKDHSVEKHPVDPAEIETIGRVLLCVCEIKFQGPERLEANGEADCLRAVWY